MKPLMLSSIAVITAIAITPISNARSSDDKANCVDGASRYVFSWPISDDCDNSPRGGTSQGVSVEISQEVHKGWQALQQDKLTKQERDHTAILAMAGGYKVDFNFLETVGYTNQFEADRPYHSWGTEYVYVLENTPSFISLQHVMVMYFQQDDGSTSDPFVMKHWRQDWRYQDSSLLEYSHANTWNKRSLTSDEVVGTWSQSVFQVDDSPRYESYGRWQHNPSFSTWLSAKTRRPLPRREYSVRQDYDALEGFNRHTITRHGWVHEEENWKLSLDDQGKPHSNTPYLSKEQGVARYQLVQNFDFAAGDQYMQNTKDFWAAVRSEWANIFAHTESITLLKKVDKQPLFMPLFSEAKKFSEMEIHDVNETQTRVRKVISKYIDKSSLTTHEKPSSANKKDHSDSKERHQY